jgi:hypothetical protein
MFGDDEAVAAGDGAYIEKGKGFGGFEEFKGGDFA